jgi:predicted RNase H-like HicB family nuclease
VTPPYHYSLLIEWDPRSDIFVVTVPELPGCRTHGKSYEEAVAQAQDAIEGWLDAQVALGRPIPQPRQFAAAS